jgi:hypothetical protein
MKQKDRDIFFCIKTTKHFKKNCSYLEKTELVYVTMKAYDELENRKKKEKKSVGLAKILNFKY